MHTGSLSRSFAVATCLLAIIGTGCAARTEIPNDSPPDEGAATVSGEMPAALPAVADALQVILYEQGWISNEPAHTNDGATELSATKAVDKVAISLQQVRDDGPTTVTILVDDERSHALDYAFMWWAAPRQIRAEREHVANTLLGLTRLRLKQIAARGALQ